MAAVVDEASFRNALIRCGVTTAAVRDAIVNAQGIASMETLTELSNKEIDAMAIAISKTPQQHGQPQLIISQVALKHIKAMREWTIWQNRQGIELDHNRYNAEEMAWMLDRMAFETRIKDSNATDRKDPPALKSLTGWRVFWKQFDSYCQQARGTMYLPLAYVYRAHTEVTAEMLDRDDYPDTDAQLMDTVQLDGNDYKVDRAMVWDVLAPLVMDGTAWPFIKRFERTKDSRGAILTLKSQAEGSASETTRKAQAYATLHTLQYNGKSRKITYENYVEKLQFAFTELLDCGEEMGESRKVDHLIRGLKSVQLESALANIYGRPDLLNSFKDANAYIKMVIAQKSSFETGRDDRGISAVGTDGKKTTTKYYSKDEWWALTEEERAEIMKNRAAGGGGNPNKRKGGGKDSGANKRGKGSDGAPKSNRALKRQIKALKAKVAAAAKGGPDSSGGESESEAEPASTAANGGPASQFGRQTAKKGTAEGKKKK